MSKTGTVQIQMQQILDEYSVEVKRATNNSMDVVAKQGLSKLKSTSPRHVPHTRKYAEGWRIGRERGSGGINTVYLYNKTNGPLTHLLEDGHVIRNKYGEFGRFNGIKHIKPVEEWAQSELPAEIERELK